MAKHEFRLRINFMQMTLLTGPRIEFIGQVMRPQQKYYSGHWREMLPHLYLFCTFHVCRKNEIGLNYLFVSILRRLNQNLTDLMSVNVTGLLHKSLNIDATIFWPSLHNVTYHMASLLGVK